MDRATTIERLKASEVELRALGVLHVSLFGSVARDEAGPLSDVDLAAVFDRTKRLTLFSIAGISDRLQEIVGAPIDLISEPARKPRLQAQIDRDRVHVF